MNNQKYTPQFKVIDIRTKQEINRDWLLEKYGSSASKIVGFALDEDGYLFLIDRCGNVFYLDEQDSLHFSVVFEKTNENTIQAA